MTTIQCHLCKATAFCEDTTGGPIPPLDWQTCWAENIGTFYLCPDHSVVGAAPFLFRDNVTFQKTDR